MQLEELTRDVVALVKQADAAVITPLRESKQLRIEDKDNSGRNFVTQADLQTEAFLKYELAKLMPQAGFIAEESDRDGAKSGLHWIIDPIDGTTNFMHDMPPFCISIALMEDSEILIGVIYEIFSKECFCAWKDGGAWLNERPIRVSSSESLSSSLLCTGFPYDHGQMQKFDRWIDLFGSLLKQTHGVRRLGAAAVDLAYVACGRFDGFYEYNLHSWDVAAGMIIVEEAGGKITDFEGGKDTLFGKTIIASNGNIHAPLQAAIEAYDFTRKANPV